MKWSGYIILLFKQSYYEPSGAQCPQDRVRNCSLVFSSSSLGEQCSPLFLKYHLSSHRRIIVLWYFCLSTVFYYHFDWYWVLHINAYFNGCNSFSEYKFDMLHYHRAPRADNRRGVLADLVRERKGLWEQGQNKQLSPVKKPNYSLNYLNGHDFLLRTVTLHLIYTLRHRGSLLRGVGWGGGLRGLEGDSRYACKSIFVCWNPDEYVSPYVTERMM